MDFDSASMTPPSSPIIGYSGSRHNESSAVSGLLYCFSCKGQVRMHDHSFSPDGYILRREVISAIKILSSTNDSLNSNNFQQPRLYKFFGRNFDMTDITQLQKLICFARKNVSTLDNLSEPSFSYGISRTTLDTEDEPDPWKLRSDVCLLFNDIVSRMVYYRDKVFTTESDIENLFGGLRKSLTKVENWPGSMKSHCGFRDGNNCPSAIYHLFHLNLEIRWSLFIIYGAKLSVLDWIFDDLINLAWFKFKYSTEAEQSLMAKHPFNCYCVKEMWTMLRLVLDELKPREKDFWDVFMTSLTRFTSSTETDVFFPIWLIVHLAPLSDYSLCGVYSPDRENEDISNQNQNSLLPPNPVCYDSVNKILREWNSKGGKVTEMMKLTSLLLPYWGFDINVVLTFFNHWLPRIDKTFEFLNFEVYKSSERWLSLITKVCSPIKKGQELDDEDEDFVKQISSDAFLSFIRLVVGHVQMCDQKSWRKLKSSFCFKLDNKNVSRYSEIGVLRTATLYLSLAFSSNDTLSLCERMADALKDAKNTPGRQKTAILAITTMYILLLQKSINITTMSEDFLRIINDLMSQSIIDSMKKDLIMVYLDLLECLPSPVTPSFSEDNLGRASLISPNLTMWLVNCGSNYLTRTLRVLTKLTSWIISSDNRISEEKDELTVAIFNRTAQFLCQTAASNQNRIPSTDLEPMATLAADLTILSRIKNIGEGFQKLFDSFAMYELTCPEVSQIYVSKLLGNKDFSNNSYSDVKWLQVWIRLISLGCSVPDELNSKVLGCVGRISDNEQFLRMFCSKQDDFNKNEIQIILSPVIVLVKSAVNALYKDPIVVSSIVKTCAILTKHLKFEKVYLRGVQNSFLHEVLSYFFPPTQSPAPWDRLPPSVVNPLKNYMLDFYVTIMSQGQFSQDSFLQRKVRDIVNFAFLGFSDRPDNPGLKIMQHACETNSEFILQDVIPRFRSLIFPDFNSALSERFLRGMTHCGHSKLWKIVLHSLPIIISIFIHQNTDRLRYCSSIVKHCCTMKDSSAKLLIRSAFESEMDAHFSFKSKRFYDLFDDICRYKPDIHLLQFLKDDLVPLIESQVITCEMKRGVGRDNSLRQPMEKLKRDIENLVLKSRV